MHEHYPAGECYFMQITETLPPSQGLCPTAACRASKLQQCIGDYRVRADKLPITADRIHHSSDGQRATLKTEEAARRHFEEEKVKFLSAFLSFYCLPRAR